MCLVRGSCAGTGPPELYPTSAQAALCWCAGGDAEGTLSQPQTSGCFLLTTDSFLCQLQACAAAEKDLWEPAQPKLSNGPKRGAAHRQGGRTPLPPASETRVKSSLTWNNRRLKLVTCQLTPPHRIDVWRLTVHPLVILVVPAIKMDAEETVHYTLHRGHTYEPGFHQIHCFHLHACLEAVVWAVLSAFKR